MSELGKNDPYIVCLGGKNVLTSLMISLEALAFSTEIASSLIW